jgi:hypothetical protein
MKTDSDTLFQTGGDMAARMAVKEWAETPLGLALRGLKVFVRLFA